MTDEVRTTPTNFLNHDHVLSTSSPSVRLRDHNIIGKLTCPLMPICMHGGCDELDSIPEALRKDIELNKLEIEH